MKPSRILAFATVAVLATLGVANAQSQWQPLTHPATFNAGALALLTDGTVLIHSEQSALGNWYKLTPDINGSYVNGAIAPISSLPAGYTPLYFSSAVLTDGRYVVEGGEYNQGSQQETNKGAIYDPKTDTWTVVTPPTGWTHIGDAPSAILPNGTYMQTENAANPGKAALLNQATLTWTATGTGKFDRYSEEGMTLLPNGNLMDVDCYVFLNMPNGKNYEIYDHNAGTWSVHGQTPVQLWDSCGGSFELGPAVLRPDGTVFQGGANGCGAGHTAIYNSLNDTWTTGPDFPGSFDQADAPAALLPDGTILTMASPGIFQTGSQFFIWDGSNLNPVSGPPNTASDSSFFGKMLVLPTGQVMFTDFSSDIEIYTPSGNPYPGIAPTVNLTSVSFTRGTTVVLGGSRFNGYSQGSAYGDDFQDATNYPIVRFTNVATNHVFYAKTHDHNTMALFGVIPTSTHVDIPANMETGLSTLEVIANGIASKKYMVGIQ
jgi:hypothetical protein